MIDLEGYMHKLADVAGEDIEEQIFVYRKVLTDIYQKGFEDGQLAEHKDASVVRQIKMRQEAADG